MITRTYLPFSALPGLRCLWLSVVLSSVAIMISACGPNEGILKSGKETPSNTAGKPKTVENYVEDMRTADFQFIYVLRRRDGGPIDTEDKNVIRLQTVDANRRIGSDDGKAFIIGSNNQVAPDKMAALQARFAVDDLSPAPVTDQANANANK